MAVCSILYQLATRPNEQQKLYEELKRVIPDPNTPLTIQLLEQCHYLKAFIKEVLRFVKFIRNLQKRLKFISIYIEYTVQLLVMVELYKKIQ